VFDNADDVPDVSPICAIGEPSNICLQAEMEPLGGTRHLARP